MCPGFKTLCPIHWTVTAASFESTVLQRLWDEAKGVAADSKVRTRVTGVEGQMEKFSYLFRVALAECIFKHTNNLSMTLQSPSLCASEDQHIADS